MRPRFSLLDAMVLVAGVAFSLALRRLSLMHVIPLPGQPTLAIIGMKMYTVPAPSFGGWLLKYWDLILRLLIFGPTLAGPALYVIHRREALGRGAALWCGLGLITWCRLALHYLAMHCARDLSRPLPWWLQTYSTYASAAVIAAWGAAVATDRGRRGGSWLDRTGLALGAAWAAYLGNCIYTQLARGYMQYP